MTGFVSWCPYPHVQGWRFLRCCPRARIRRRFWLFGRPVCAVCGQRPIAESTWFYSSAAAVHRAGQGQLEPGDVTVVRR